VAAGHGTRILARAGRVFGSEDPTAHISIFSEKCRSKSIRKARVGVVGTEFRNFVLSHCARCGRIAAMLSADEIRIEELELFVRLGVPESERAQPQRVTLSFVLESGKSFSEARDDLARTIDYGEVCEEVKHFTNGRVFQLIETMSDQIATHLLERFPLQSVEVELRKFVRPDTRFISARIKRTKATYVAGKI
jgi:dihydroneopterin aldolase